MRSILVRGAASLLLAACGLAQDIQFSEAMLEYRDKEFRLSYPENWRTFGDTDSAGVTITSPEAVTREGSGAMNVAYGAVVSYYYPEGKVNLDKATRQLVEHLQSSNPGMKPGTTPPARVTVDGQKALLTFLSATSSYPGATEVDKLVTVARPKGLFYIVFVAPDKQAAKLQPLFDKMLASVKFTR